MSLRSRTAIAVGLLVAAAIAVTGLVLVNSARQELHHEVDAFLDERADRIAPSEFLEGRRGRSPRGTFGSGRFSEDDAIAQLVTAEGVVVNLTDTVIPVEQRDIDVAAGHDDVRTFRTTTIEGVEHRVLTAGIPRVDAALMVARDLTEVNTALSGLRRRTIALGSVGVALSALVAWVLADRLSRPLDRLASAAEHVAATQDLSAPIDIEPDRRDEVGRLATSFNTMLAALRTSRDQQQRLVMDASHELRTPLTSLRTNIDLLRRADRLDGEVRDEVLGDVSRELDELSVLVAELVELSTSSRRPDEPVEDVDLGALAEDVSARARRRFDRAVEVVAVNPPAVISGHRALLDRALWNLVDNAVKFSPHPTPVEIRLDGNTVTVVDQGPGVDPVDRPHIFDRFYRSTSTRSAPGSGLGLSIVADVVATHRGSCFVADAAEGEGAAIGFTVPGL